MQNKISNDLISISSLLLLAREQSEIIRIAGELNSVIQNAMELEKSENYNFSIRKEKRSSTSIKFTMQEVNQMSKTFKKEFIANGCVSHIIARPSGKNGKIYEIRYRRNGYNISVSNKDLNTAKALFIVATKNLQSPDLMYRTNLTFGDMVKEFIEYKKDKISLHSWQCYDKRAKTQLPPELLHKRIKDIRTVDIDRFMRNYDTQPRMYEEMRTLLNSVFKYTIASGIITHNPVTLVPFKRAKRKNRAAMTDEQIKEFLLRLKEPMFDEIRQAAYVLYFFGIRPCELDEEAHFENGFLICRNRKRKNGAIEYKKIPIPKQAQGVIDFDKPITFPYSASKNTKILEEALGNGLTPYNLRHTFASVCSEFVRPDVVEVWMGDSAEHLVGRVYVHFKDEFMKAQMDKVEFII